MIGEVKRVRGRKGEGGEGAGVIDTEGTRILAAVCFLLLPMKKTLYLKCASLLNIIKTPSWNDGLGSYTNSIIRISVDRFILSFLC